LKQPAGRSESRLKIDLGGQFASSIEFVPAHPEAPGAHDKRKLGIGFFHLGVAE
jgi:hypothetical protein